MVTSIPHLLATAAFAAVAIAAAAMLAQELTRDIRPYSKGSRND